jgi:hypothetical protein
MILNCSRTGATVLTEASQTLITTFRATWTALAKARTDYPRARALAAELGEPARDTDPRIVAAVEAAMLPVASQLSVKRLRAATRRELLARDAEAAERRRKRAGRSADVVVRSIGDGMAELVTTMAAPLSAATFDVVDQYARMAKADGDERTLGQLRSAFLADLALRPWDTSRPPVTAQVTVVAPLPALQQRPGAVAEVDGQAIIAAHARELLESLEALCPGGLQAPAGGCLTVAGVAPASGELLAATTPQELRRGRPPWLPRPSRRVVHLPGARPAPTDRPIHAYSRSAAMGHDARSHVPTSRLRQPFRMGGSGPCRSARGRRPDRLRQSLLPVPPPRSAEDPRPRVAVRPASRRHPDGHHADRRHPRDPATGSARPRRAPAGTARRTGGPGR